MKLAFALSAAIFAMGMASPHEAEPVQVECGVDGGFYVHLEVFSATGEKVGGPYMLTFGAAGPGFLLPDGKYAPDWSDVKSVGFVYRKDGATGRLSMSLEQNGRSFVQRVGILKNDCWKLGKEWLEHHHSEIPIIESTGGA